MAFSIRRRAAEQTRASRPRPPGCRRSEGTASIQTRKRWRNVKLSAVYTYRREKNLQATSNPAPNVYGTTPTTAVDPGLDGVVGTADDSTYQFFQRISAANPSLITNDPTVLQSYKGLEITLTKRLSNRWQMLAGYTLAKNRLSDVSDAEGEPTAVRHELDPVGFRIPEGERDVRRLQFTIRDPVGRKRQQVALPRNGA